MKPYRKIHLLNKAALAELGVGFHLTPLPHVMPSEDPPVNLKVAIRTIGQPVGAAPSQEYSVTGGDSSYRL